MRLNCQSISADAVSKACYVVN